MPEDVALAAVDDPAWAELVDPPLTTLAQPVRRMAQMAMELVLERIAGRREPRRIVLPMELRVRSSCGHATRARLMAKVGLLSVSDGRASVHGDVGRFAARGGGPDRQRARGRAATSRAGKRRRLDE